MRCFIGFCFWKNVFFNTPERGRMFKQQTEIHWGFVMIYPSSFPFRCVHLQRMPFGVDPQSLRFCGFIPCASYWETNGFLRVTLNVRTTMINSNSSIGSELSFYSSMCGIQGPSVANYSFKCNDQMPAAFASRTNLCRVTLI